MNDLYTVNSDIHEHNTRQKTSLTYYQKGDPLVCGSYRAIKLLEQPMKVLERVLEKRIRCCAVVISQLLSVILNNSETI